MSIYNLVTDDLYFIFKGVMNMSSISDLFGTTSSSSTDMYSTLFGSSSNTSSGVGSLSSSLGDYNLIRSGAYKKLQQAYYSKVANDSNSDAETIKGSGTTDSKANLSTLKSAAGKLKSSAQTLQKKDYSKTEDALEDVKSFISDYNSTLNATKKLNSYSILQTGVWATEAMGASESTLEKLGITIGEDNTLSIDEEKFKSADVSALKALFSGSGSLADRISAKASSLELQSANQIAVNSGKGIYTSSGTIA